MRQVWALFFCVYSKAQHSTAQHSTAQHSTAQCSAAQQTRYELYCSNQPTCIKLCHPPPHGPPYPDAGVPEHDRYYTMSGCKLTLKIHIWSHLLNMAHRHSKLYHTKHHTLVVGESVDRTSGGQTKAMIWYAQLPLSNVHSCANIQV